jgi:glutamate dehydrogenase (NAD(P)+)
VSSWDGTDRTVYTFRKTSGVDPHALSRLTDRFGSIERNRARELGHEVLPGSAWLEQEVDVLIPAALEHQITMANVLRIHGRVLVVAEAEGISLRDAAYLIAVDRVAHACRERGWVR